MKKLVIILLILPVFLLVSGCGAVSHTESLSMSTEPTPLDTPTPTPVPLKMPVIIVQMGFNKIAEDSYGLQVQVQNTGEKVVTGYKIKIQLFDMDGKVISRYGSDYDAIIDKGVNLEKGYMTDRDLSTSIYNVPGFTSFRAAVIECTYEDGSVTELADAELEWVTYP